MNKLESKRRNYGVLTDLSKSANVVLGDKSGRTVSMRTANGLQRTVNTGMSENLAEDIAHIGMVASGVLLFSKNKQSRMSGLISLFFLFVCYQAGKDNV